MVKNLFSKSILIGPTNGTCLILPSAIVTALFSSSSKGTAVKIYPLSESSKK